MIRKHAGLKYNKKNFKSSDLPSGDLPKELEPTSDIT